MVRPADQLAGSFENGPADGKGNTMKALLAGVLLLIGCWCTPAISQTLVPVEPAGGMTIEYLMGRSDEWHLAVFPAGITEIENNCVTMTNSSYGASILNRKVVWISPTSGGRKQLFNQLALAQSLGKKLVGITMDISPGYCVLFAARMAP